MSKIEDTKTQTQMKKKIVVDESDQNAQDERLLKAKIKIIETEREIESINENEKAEGKDEEMKE
jgi:hypothetical protein